MSPPRRRSSPIHRPSFSRSVLRSVRPPSRPSVRPLVDPEDPDILWKEEDSELPVITTRSIVHRKLRGQFGQWFERRTEGEDPEQISLIREILEPWFVYLETERVTQELNLTNNPLALSTFDTLPPSPEVTRPATPPPE